MNKKLAQNMRKQIAGAFSIQKEYSLLFKKELVEHILPEWLTDPEEVSLVREFKGFTTYFTNFHTNRKNMYVSDDKSTAVSFRIINQNLPKFLDNVKSFDKVKMFLPEENLITLNNTFKGLFNTTVENCFTWEYFNFVLTQSGIENYNQIIGGLKTEDGIKVKGLNEYINEFNQVNRENKLPKMKMLFKQILNDKTTLSFIPEKFELDQEVLNAINDFYSSTHEDTGLDIKSLLIKIMELFNIFDVFDNRYIFIKNGPSITDISNKAFGSWEIIPKGLNEKYNISKKILEEKITEKQIQDRKKYLKKIESYSIAQIQEFGENSLSKYLQDEVKAQVECIEKNHQILSAVLSNPYDIQKKLAKDYDTIYKVKEFLDSIKDLQFFMKPLLGSGQESEKDNRFYGEFEAYYHQLEDITTLYDKVRNYVTQKPYSLDKIKINFGKSTLLDGWDINKESDNLGAILIKDGNYYLAIINAKHSKVIQQLKECSDKEEHYEKMNYKLLPGPNKMLPKVFFSKKWESEHGTQEIIKKLYENNEHKKGETFKLESCHKLIDFFKESIEKYPEWKGFNFQFQNTDTYLDLSGFYNEVSLQGYKMDFKRISTKEIEDLVDEGKVYLFKIYNKDFSEHSKGMPNLHTLYFKALFDEYNLKDIVYKLNGQAEIFYRKPSLTVAETAVHPANQKIMNKNPLQEKKESSFTYDIIKDRRYTKPQFNLHLPITMNFKAQGNERINLAVRNALKKEEKPYVIGIDRGERHLIYVSVIDYKGDIVEQYSLNEIINEYDGVSYNTDYHNLLQNKEDERLKQRQNWECIENIKELKEGYISQVVHKICQLVEKYDAVIAMEDLNSGFKNSRIKVERQTYQKFEKMLIDKLNYYVNKSKSMTEKGGLLQAYQLTEKFESFTKMTRQNGFIFYVPAWLTSKIDPTTGFVDLLKPKFSSVVQAQDFISKFDEIKFNEQENYFEFYCNYDKFPRTQADYKKHWTICTYGERIFTERDKEKNGQWNSKTVNLTQEFITLFDEFHITYTDSNLQEQILMQKDARFYKTLMHLLRLTLQMRNSKTGSSIDYLISPVKNKQGNFYDSEASLKSQPDNADANGAYHIALKALWAIQQIHKTEDVQFEKVKLSISNKEWLEFAQRRGEGKK